MPIDDKVSLKKIALMTEGYSGADLENLCREAGMSAIREKKEKFDKVKQKHFDFALNKIKSTLPADIIQKYKEMAKSITESRNIKENSADLYK